MSEPHLDAIERVLWEHRDTVIDPERSTSAWVYNMCQCGGSIAGGHRRHIAREIAAAVGLEEREVVTDFTLGSERHRIVRRRQVTPWVVITPS